jgi:group I intron endonuclease
MGAIYQITNTKTGEFYIGSSVRASRRKFQHFCELRKGCHPSRKFQASWDAYGEYVFVMEIIEHDVPMEILRVIEQKYLDNEASNEKCLNAKITREDFAISEEAKAKIAKTLRSYYATHHSPMKGKKHTPEALAKMQLKHVPKGEEHYRFGKTLSDETRKKIGDTQRGKKKGPRKYTEEGLRKIRAAAERGAYKGWAGKTHTQESKDKMSKPIREVTTGTEFTSLTNALEYYGMLMPTMTRALKSGKPITKGDKRGLQFIYADSVNKAAANPNLHGERYAAPVIDYTHCSIEGCDNPHKAKGFCMYHYKQNRKSA